MRLFYIKYPNGVTMSHLLSWSHYYELLKIKDDLERNFYEKQTLIEIWTIRELRRQKKTGLFQRIALSKNKNEILKLANKHNFVDLAFYNYILKCFVLIDLKVNEVEHKDVGQMITYLNYFNKKVISENDNETIGIILASEKDDN